MKCILSMENVRLKPHSVSYIFKKVRSSVFASDIKPPQRLYIFTLARERVQTHLEPLMKAISPCFGGKMDTIRETHIMHYKSSSNFLEKKSSTVTGKIFVYAETIGEDEPMINNDRLKIAMERISRRRKGLPVEYLPTPVEPKYLNDAIRTIIDTDEFIDDVEKETANV